MLSKEEQLQIISLLKHEVVPAIGCTEPVAVALCAARAAEKIGSLPEKVEVELSMNVLKNAMGVGIPGTGMIGLPIAIALGMIVGKSDYKLEVLKNVTPEAVERGKKYINESRISIRLKEDAPDGLYIRVCAYLDDRTETAIICGEHTRFIEEDSFKDLQAEKSGPTCDNRANVKLTLRRIYDFISEVPF
jgi:L-cysteine desulfidase